MFFLKPVNKVQISADDHGLVSDHYNMKSWILIDKIVDLKKIVDM